MTHFPENHLQLTTYTVGQNGHFSFPRRFKFSNHVEQVRWQVIMNEDCNYLLQEKDGTRSRDQRDWNKLCGVFYAWFNTRKDTAMMGWRYNPDTDNIELAPYYHISGSRDLLEEPLMTVKRCELFEVVLTIDRSCKKYQWEMRKSDYKCAHEISFHHYRMTCGYINFYFGGNRRAPQWVSAQIGMEIRKIERKGYSPVLPFE